MPLDEESALLDAIEEVRSSAPPPQVFAPPAPRQTGKRLKAVVIPAEEVRAHLERISSLPPMPAAKAAAPEPEPSSVRFEAGPAPSAMARASSVPPPPASAAPSSEPPPSVRPSVLLPMSFIPASAAPASVAPAPAAPHRALLLSATDVFDVLFDAMHELPYFETAVEGGSYCLATALSALPARAGLVHLYDIDAREFVVVYTHGDGYERTLLSRASESDAVLAPAMFRHRAMAVRTLGTTRVERHRTNASVLVAPVLDGGRFLGAIELVDPLPGHPFDERAMNALTYVADRYAQFLAERGVAIGNLVALAG